MMLMSRNKCDGALAQFKLKHSAMQSAPFPQPAHTPNCLRLRRS